MSTSRHTTALLVTLFCIGLIGALWALSHGHTFALFETKGQLATKERDLLLKTTLLLSTVIIPVFAMTFFFAWRYRQDNTTAKYSPESAHAKYDELIWWAIPAEIILVLGIITWQSTQELDPYKPLSNDHAKPLKIQAVAMNWKWLFIYPEKGIATVNLLEIPENTPIDLSITADAPMNSFWVPELAGQIYAMPGMVTKLHFDARTTGDFSGRSANFSGPGFSDMTFTVRSVNADTYTRWSEAIARNLEILDESSYKTLATPSVVKEPIIYGRTDGHLFDSIANKYMTERSPASESNSAAPAMDHMN